MIKGTGALPPPGCEWEIGKTAASIAFVRHANVALDAATVPSFAKDGLRAKVDAVKSGRLVLDSFTDMHEVIRLVQAFTETGSEEQ